MYVVYMRQEGLVVAALLALVRPSLKVAIFYINGALLKPNRNALYIGDFFLHKRLGCAFLRW